MIPYQLTSDLVTPGVTADLKKQQGGEVWGLNNNTRTGPKPSEAKVDTTTDASIGVMFQKICGFMAKAEKNFVDIQDTLREHQYRFEQWDNKDAVEMDPGGNFDDDAVGLRMQRNRKGYDQGLKMGDYMAIEESRRHARFFWSHFGDVTSQTRRP